MRLTIEQAKAIRQTTAEIFDATTPVWLFGSRVDDSKRGGDIDLLVAPQALNAEQALQAKIRFLNKLEKRLGERKVDLIIEMPNDTRSIVQIAHQTGVPL